MKLVEMSNHLYDEVRIYPFHEPQETVSPLTGCIEVRRMRASGSVFVGANLNLNNFEAPDRFDLVLAAMNRAAELTKLYIAGTPAPIVGSD